MFSIKHSVITVMSAVTNIKSHYIVIHFKRSKIKKKLTEKNEYAKYIGSLSFFLLVFKQQLFFSMIS